MDDEETEQVFDVGNVPEANETEGEEDERGEEDEEELPEEEGEEEEEEVREEEEEEEIEEVVSYNPDDFISQPYLSEKSTLPANIIEFNYSFGYDCKRLFNLCVIDKEVIIFASGNLIHFLKAGTGEMWFRRCSSGKGIGHIATNPVLPHVAVGEKGDNPDIIIYEWPSFEIVSVLKNGTKQAYSHLNYSPDGEMLCSQGSYPDYMLTIWNWRKRKIMLRAKAYGEKVFNARFSLYDSGSLTTSGTSHIKFWKINQTFTGLKLQGELGRFGKTEICNIVGFLALPDEKVVSGSEWGNILVWDGGLIRVEVFRRGKNNCHEAPITQFIYNNGEMMTVAMDGTIKIWYYETIELADPPEEERFIEVEPIFEFEIGDYYHKAELMVVVKSDPDPNNTIWFGQDGNGGIWKLDLSTALSAAPPQEIFQCHSGHVVAIQASPVSTQFATLGRDGRLLVYDYKLRQLLMKKEFLFGGRCLLWLPLSVEPSGSILLGGFDDGVVRIICVSVTEYLRKIPSPTEDYVNLIQVSKPHSKPITAIALNPRGKIVVTGSEDSTIFVYQIAQGNQFIELVPIGFIPIPGPASCSSWKPDTASTILVGCSNGAFAEIELPVEPPEEEPKSYLIQDANMLQSNFVSIKGEIRRNQRIEQIKEERRAQAAARRREEAGEEEGLGPKSSEEDEVEEDMEEIDESELPEAYVPPQPNPILIATYSPSGNVWLSVAGYDSGYMYEYNFTDTEPVLATMMNDADDIEIRSHRYYHNKRYLVLGMQDGKVRVVRVNEDDPNDFSDYWSYSMHDNDNGIIYQICFNYKYNYMFTCGSDGNVFSYRFNPEMNDFKIDSTEKAISKGFVGIPHAKKRVDHGSLLRKHVPPIPDTPEAGTMMWELARALPTTCLPFQPENPCADIDDPDEMSLEQAKIKIEHEHQLRIANAHKRDVMETLKTLEKRYEALLRRNAKLPKSQQLTKEELVLDSRVTDDLEKSLEEEMNLVKRKLAWNLEKSRCQYEKLKRYYIDPVETQTLRVYGIEMKDRYVETFRLRALGSEFEECKKLVAQKLEEQELKGRAQARLFSEEEIIEVVTRRPNPAEALLKQIMALCGDYKKNIKLRRLLRKYRERKDKLETRRIEWHEMMRKRPNPDKPDPEDLEAIRIAKEYIGDYKLKTAPDYKVPPEKKITTVSTYDKLLKLREEIYNVKKSYNDKVLDLRQRKLSMIERHSQLRQTLLEIAKEIPKEKVRDPPELPQCDEEVEFPEKKLSYTENDVLDELPKRLRNLYRVTPAKKKELKLLDKEYEMLISEKSQKPGKTETKLNLMKFGEIIGAEAVAGLEETAMDDQVPTPWEREYKKLRVIRRLYEQDGIIDEMENDIKNYDNEISALKEAKYKAEVDVKFLQLYLLTVHQEVLILKKFEAAEEEKENKLLEKLMEKHEIQKKLNEIGSKIESRNREIRKCEEEIKNLVTSYYAAITDNKFYDFLRRIFKKKYRPPKVKTDDSDSESESESSSSSEEEDARSLDSKDIGPMRLDEGICPPGCDPQLYEWTFKQRSERHALELTITEEKRLIELHKKDYEQLIKKIKVVEVQYNNCQDDLEEYIREKQRNLNEVETVVVLKMQQVQNLKNEKELEKLSESIVFSAKRLSNLYKRVGELDKETQVEKQKHAKNCQHLTRMKIDVNHMKDVIAKLSKEIEETMMRKFGTKIEIDDVEESLLKRLVADMHSVVLELEAQFKLQLRSLREKLSEREETYAMKTQENTERNNLVAVLEEEKANLLQTLARQKKAICEEEPEKEDEKEDIERLEKIGREQGERISCLRSEIQMLKMKASPVPQIPGHYTSEVPGVLQRLVIGSLDGECDEISAEVRNELKDIYDEAQEIAHDLRDGVVDGSDVARMRKLTQDFVGKLPPRVQESVIQKLSGKNLVGEANVKKCEDQTVYLKELVRAVPAEYFLEVMDMVTEIMDSISTSIEGGQPEP